MTPYSPYPILLLPFWDKGAKRVPVSNETNGQFPLKENFPWKSK